MENVITLDQNLNLTGEFTLEELKTTVFSMHPNKAPGLDGYIPIFYQKNWNMIKTDLLRFLNNCLKNPNYLADINNTIITLIPKINQPYKIKDYRPISLCNVLYRIFSKLLANRLKPLLDDLISPFQNAFVKHRQISDNSIIVKEIMHNMNKKKKGLNDIMAIKVDMHKAFDQLEWPFIIKILQNLGFSTKWCSIIEACLHCQSFSFNLNGAPFGKVIPSRGVRQGDPLSPFLFILCFEFLSRSLTNLINLGEVQGVKLA